LPLYAYRCTQCGHRFEKIQNFSAEPESVCPQCGGVLERPLTAPALQFKGAGWYINDYAPKAASGSGTTSSESAGSESKAAESKPSESKPAESAPAAETKAPSAAPSSPKPTASGNS
jgi:putative FmdB family regulatory protein